MKTDPIDLFTRAVSGVFGRMTIAWFAIGLGWLLALGIRGGDWEMAFISLLLLPLSVGLSAMTCGLWLIIAIPLAVLLAMRAFTFITGHGSGRDAKTLPLITYLIAMDPFSHGDFIAKMIVALLLTGVTLVKVDSVR